MPIWNMENGLMRNMGMQVYLYIMSPMMFRHSGCKYNFIWKCECLGVNLQKI